jgi:ABC-type phosphate/phosphonate transport system substrate-binding protein
MDRRCFVAGIGSLPLLYAGSQVLANAKDADEGLTMVVMDPMSAPLACACVQGYAQRKYEFLGKFLEQQLGTKVKVHWAGALSSALEESMGKADIVIGKRSVVEADSDETQIPLSPIAELTGKDGKTTQWGLVVVRKDDAAKKLEDLAGYQILFGKKEADEKYAAPKKLFADKKVAIAEKEECIGACSEAVTNLIDMEPGTKAAAVISSYAKPLLEGCGTIKKGDVRVVGETEKVPFITAFVNSTLPVDLREKITASLLNVKQEPALLLSLETRDGFVPMLASAEDKSEQPTTAKKN